MKVEKPEKPEAGASRACWARYNSLTRAFRDGWRRWSLEELRQAFPFSTTNARPVMHSIPDLGDVNEAVKAYQRPKDYFTSRAYLRLYERADYQFCPMPLRLFVWKYLRALRARGLPFYVHTCYRTPGEQAELKAGGYSNLALGAHQRSCAVDIVSAIDHWEIPEELWYYVGTLGESVARGTEFGPSLRKGKDGSPLPLKIQWGGRWTDPWDPAHWQLSDWRYRPTFKADSVPLRLSPYSDRMRFG